jgi:kinesin family protein C1
VFDSDDRASHDTGVHDATKNRVKVKEPHKDRGGLKDRRKTWEYSFDKVFTPDHGQEDVWDSTEPLVQCAVDGFNVTIFAYGQTGSGKTHTMLGEPGNEGIVARSVKKLFSAKDELEGLARGECQVTISVELLEVYNEKIRDLVAPKCGPNGEEINVKVTSQEVVGNTVVETSTEQQVTEILNLAQKRRCVKATSSNAESSRSHMLFTIHFDVSMKDGTVRTGKLNVCDLAGSERLDKSGANIVGVSQLYLIS